MISAWLTQLRPLCWLLFITHGYLGFLLGANALLPALEHLEAAALWDWLTMTKSFWLALVCLGPLVGGFTLVINDIYDLETDRYNPRRCRVPIVDGRLSMQAVRAVTWLQAGTGLLLASFISRTFLGLAVVGAFLGWAYAAPPLRFKARPGLDVLANAAGVGIVCPLAGWSLAQPWESFPWGLAVVNALGAAGAYMSTALMDEPYDRAVRLQTIAVALGHKQAKRLGWTLWLLYLLGLLAAATFDYGLPRVLLPALLGLSPLLMWQYARVLRAAEQGESKACWRQVVQLCALWHVMVLLLATVYTMKEI